MIKSEGRIIKKHKDLNFLVELDDDQEAMCYISGKMRQNHISLVENDRVEVEMSPHDLGRGRIIYRLD